MNVVPRFDTIFSGKPCSLKTLAINASANLSAVQVSFAGVKWDVLKNDLQLPSQSQNPLKLAVSQLNQLQ